MRILIIKTSATGDVVRTTAILQAFPQASISWITSRACFPLFDEITQARQNENPDSRLNENPDSRLNEDSGNHLNENTRDCLKIFDIQDIPESVLQETYDFVLSLEEDDFCAKLAASLNTRKLTGVYSNGKIRYTEDAAPWFDMSLISIYGKEYANSLKMANGRSYQDFLFGMIGRQFTGQPYRIYQPQTDQKPNLIGIEKHAGHRWPGKQWTGYEMLAQKLQEAGFDILLFERRAHLRQYMTDIASCRLIVSGDTLAMHLALAYRLPVVALFNCTSAAEIYDYGLLIKMINPLLKDYFYSTHTEPKLISAIPVEAVFKTVTDCWELHYQSCPQIKDTAVS